ncbi:MAG: hypothetical protein U0840_21645 [Gemmataceae bacterium]
MIPTNRIARYCFAEGMDAPDPSRMVIDCDAGGLLQELARAGLLTPGNGPGGL